MEILEIKNNNVSEIKNLFSGLNSNLGTAEGIIHELKYRSKQLFKLKLKLIIEKTKQKNIHKQNI